MTLGIMNTVRVNFQPSGALVQYSDNVPKPTCGDQGNRTTRAGFNAMRNELLVNRLI